MPSGVTSWVPSGVEKMLGSSGTISLAAFRVTTPSRPASSVTLSVPAIWPRRT